MGTPSNTTKYRHKGTEKTHKSILYKGFILYVMIHGIYLRIEQSASTSKRIVMSSISTTISGGGAPAG